MGFLAPLFLIGLAAVAVPVLIHLTHRQRREPIAFPSLMFLRRIEFRTTKRQRIRNWLLFLLRALGVLLLALAFSRPFVQRADASAATDGGRDVVVLLDASLSMGLGDRWALAQDEARKQVAALGPRDRGTVVRFASRAEALTESTGDKGMLEAAVGAARPGSDAGRYAPGIALARGILARGERPRKEVVLVGDLQRAGWAPDADVALPAGTVLRVVDVGAGDSANVAVTGLELQRTTGTGNRVELVAVARIANLGGAARPVPVALAIDGRELARATVALPASGVSTVSLGPVALPAGVVRGTVTAGSDALAGDDVRHFTVDRGRTLRTLLVEDPAASPARALYLQRALGLRGEPPFEVELRRGTDLAAADLAGRAAVIWHDAPAPRGAALRLLTGFVEAGGGLVAAFGDRTRPADWQGEAGALLAARPGETLDRMADRGGRLGALDRTHPLLEPFAEPGSGNFSTPRFFRYRPLEPAPGGAVVARFDDGRVALAERRVGRGRTLAWASTFDNVWNDLPLHAVWVPLVRQVVQHAAAWRDEPAWRTVGEAVDASAFAQGTAVDATAEYVAVAPSGAQARLTGAAPTLELTEPGIWEIRRFGEGNAPARLVAVNVDPRESDLTRIPEAELVAAVAPRGEAAAAGADAVVLTASERESRQSIWWFLLLGAALLLAAETLLSNRLTRAGR